MTNEGFIKLLKNEVKLSEGQIQFNALRGHDDQYEKGYKDALEMVISNLRVIDSIPTSFIWECINKADDWAFDKDTLVELIHSWEDNK